MELWQRTSRRLARHRYAVDVVVVVVVLPLAALTSFDLLNAGGVGSPRGWAVVMIAPLAVRRRWPVASSVAVFSVGAIKLLVGPELVFPADLAVLVALYSVTLHGPRWAGRTAMIGIGVGTVGVGIRTLRFFALGAVPQTVMLMALLLTLGLATWGFALLKRSRQETLDALRDRADRLERERDQQARLAAVAERARIAREMHDIVAHSLSIVIAQADGGRYAAREDPGAAVGVLDTISQTGRAALADMRRILGVLRGGTDTASPTRTADDAETSVGPLAPQPATEDIDALVARVRATGVRISIAEVGRARLLPPGMELTVYRILQEALTNVLKHAGPDPTVTVLRRWGPRTLTLEVTDDGRGAAADAQDAAGGHGLVGMRERAALFDGVVHAGPRDGGGFRVRVELPLPDADTSADAPVALRPPPATAVAPAPPVLPPVPPVPPPPAGQRRTQTPASDASSGGFPS